MKHPILSCLVALSATALLAFVPVRQGQAADAVPKKPATASPPAAPAAKSKPNVMTRDELRACLDERDKLQEVRARVLKEDAALNAQRAEIQKLDAEQAQKREALLTTEDAAAREAFSAEVAKRNQMVEDYKSRSLALVEQSKALDERRAAWLGRCDRPFDEMDEAVIMRERKRAAGTAK
jgi:small-conductance mechanosensitive channel